MRSPSFRKHHRFFLSLLLLLLFIASCIFLADGAITLKNTSFTFCPSFDCGNGVLIEYPFTASPSVLGINSDYYRGYREFSVTCQGDKPIFKTFTNSYIVKGINETNKTISLVDADVLGEDCPKVKRSLDITNIPMLSRPSSVVDLSFFFNCSQQNLQIAQNEVGCLSAVIGVSYVFDSAILTQTHNKILTESCRGSVTSTVLKKELDSIEGNISRSFGTVLQKGFDLRWGRIGSNCVQCEKNGGHCGYENNTQSEGMVFTCFCSDGIRDSKDCSNLSPTETLGYLLALSIFVLGLGIFLLPSIGWCILFCKRSKWIKNKKL